MHCPGTNIADALFRHRLARPTSHERLWSLTQAMIMLDAFWIFIDLPGGKTMFKVRNLLYLITNNCQGNLSGNLLSLNIPQLNRLDGSIGYFFTYEFMNWLMASEPARADVNESYREWVALLGVCLVTRWFLNHTSEYLHP